MSVKVEGVDKNVATLTVELAPEELEKALTKAYNKIKNQVSIPGFRKGKVPQKMVERTYGVEVLFEDASNFLVEDSYAGAVEESGLKVVAQPDIEVVTIERGKPFVYTAVVAVKPEVKLAEYKGLEYVKMDTTVSEDAVNAQLEQAREQNSRLVPVTDRVAQLGDTVAIDFDGYTDGQPFDGGKAENYSLELGTHSFVDTFEDQIVGHNVGDEFDVNVKFPEDYAPELAGKDATFKCKLNEIKLKELPELDDEFAGEVSEFDTLEEYKADIRKNLEESNKQRQKKAALDKIVKDLADASEMDIPNAMIDEQARQLARDFSQRMESQGISLKQYLDIVKQTPEQFMEEIKPQALNNIKQRLTLEAVVKAENFEVSDEDVEKNIEDMAAQYGMAVDKLKEFLSPEEREYLVEDIKVSKAADFLFDNAVGVEAPAEEPKAEEAEKTEE